MKPTTSNRGLKRPHESYVQSKTDEIRFKTKEDIANFLCCDSDDDSDGIEDNKLLSKEGVRRLLKQDDLDAEDDDDSESCTNMPEEEEEHFSKPDEIEITPFNLDEELREGNFDASGTYILNKNPDEIKDVWADSIDWAAIKKNEQTLASTSQEADKTSDDESNESKDKIHYFKQMLRIMKPNETVKKTMRRLGDQIPKKCFKSKATVKPEQPKLSAEEIDECKRKLDIMIESAHICLKLGDVDIYSKTFDDLEEAIDI